MMSIQEMVMQEIEEKGEVKNARKIAKKLFHKGMNRDEIQEITELSSAELAKIKEELKNE